MRSLSLKLAGGLLLVVIISVGLTSLLTHLSTTREFRRYVLEGSSIHARGAEQSLADYYLRERKWDGVQGMLSGLLGMSGDRLIVADANGIVVGDTSLYALGESVDKLGLTDYITQIPVSGKNVGSFYYLSYGMSGMEGMMAGSRLAPNSVNNAEVSFLDHVKSSAWIAGLIAMSLALLLGLLLTRQITVPVQALIKGARQISRGNLAYQVKVQTKDELGELVSSFNTMAASLTKSEELKQRMTADIAHELRTPLTVIQGTVDGMLDGVFPTNSEHLTVIKKEAMMLTGLIADLRELSLAESGHLSLNLTCDNITKLLKRKIEQMHVTARSKNISLTLNVDGIIPELNVDQSRIEQVVSNLLTNAIIHTHPGGSIDINVRGLKRSEGALIAVSDTGEGIAAEHLPYIFDRFYRVSDSRSRNEGGTGLGLAIVKQLVQAHGGKVWVQSKLGKGSTFFVFLPFNYGI